MRRAFFFSVCAGALPLAACSKISPSGNSAPLVPPVPELAAPQALPDPQPPGEPAEALPAPEPPADAPALERRFFAAQNDPVARIAVVQEMADVPPAAGLAMLNRLFPIERREDVKMEMLAVLGDFDHEKDRDNQLALCLKALAPNQPPRLRYVAVHVLATLDDPRGRALLIPLTRDNDREVRAAAVESLRELREE